MRTIRVAHCLETVGSGGVEQTRLLLAEKLDRSRYDQIVVCTQAKGALPDKIRAAGCPIYEIGVLKNIFDWNRYSGALNVLKKFRPDVVHGAVFEGVATAALAGRWANIPIIIGEETSDPVNRKMRAHFLYRGLTSLTHHMVAVSPAVERYLVECIKIPKARVTLINNGVDDPGPATSAKLLEIRRRYGIAKHDIVVGTVGRLLDGHKRVSDLIKALAVVRESHPSVKLLVVGDGPDRSTLEALARECGLAGAVIFAGYQPITRPYFELMDVFALASAYEAFGLVLVEAMFADLPVVSTRVGGIPDVVADGQTGTLVPPASVNELAVAISELLSNPAKRKAMGVAGKVRAQMHFSADRYVREVDYLYQRLATERGLI